jgi:cyclophilin family peptidyl-prolyl cis-trans isomerase/protein-disulfide isomerase
LKMRKTVLSVLLFGLLLSACSSTSASPTVAATSVPVATTSATTAAAQSTLSAAQPTDIPIPEGPATCAAAGSTLPTPEPTVAAIAKSVPAVTDQDWQIGKADAPITFVEYSDFQCPYCAQLAPALEQLVKDDPDVRVVYRHFPLPSHPLSLIASAAAEAAGVQGKFWEYYAALFSGQATWSPMAEADATKWMVDEAGTLGLDTTKFTTDMNSDAIKNKVVKARQDAVAMNIPYTPFLMINGQPWESGSDINTLEILTSLQKAESKRFSACPPMTVDANKKYTATIKTGKGDIVIELYPKQAPWAVNSFVYLAQQGWFDGVTFHRVISNFVAQTGDPSGTGYGGPGYLFGTEISSDLNFDQEGMVGMARGTDPNTNGSQFFITLGPVNTLDGKYTVFGKVTSGMDVVKQITERNQANSSTILPPGDKITSISIEIQ